MSDALTVNDLTCNFDVSAPWLNRVIERKQRQFVRAVDDISFTVPMGGCLSLVGESGCGKSTVARLVTGLYRASEGEVRFAPGKNGQPLSAQMIFQDPYASLNPRWRVRNIIAEPLRELKLRNSEDEIMERVGELLTIVGLAHRTAPSSRMNSPADSVSASRSHGRLPASRSSSSATSRPRRSTSRSRPRS